jgi:hypothetical protein
MASVCKIKQLSRWVWFLSTLGIGCTGVINPPGGPQGSEGNGGGVPGATQGPPGSVPPPMGGVGGTSFIDPRPGALERLTNSEYSQTVTDLLGEPPGASITYKFPEDPRQHGFDDNVDLMHISTAHADRYAAAAEAIAVATFASPARRSMVLTCDPSTGAACLTTFIQSTGRRIYRRRRGKRFVSARRQHRRGHRPHVRSPSRLAGNASVPEFPVSRGDRGRRSGNTDGGRIERIRVVDAPFLFALGNFP